MKRLLAVIAALSSNIFIAQSTAAAQDGIVNIPSPNKEHWRTIVNNEKIVFLHKKSGAICQSQILDLTLVGIKDYTPNGDNSSCQYEKKTAVGLKRLTQFIYTYPNFSPGAEYNGSKNAILSSGQRTSVTVAEDKKEGGQCFNAISKSLSDPLLKIERKINPDADKNSLAFGLSMFNMDFRGSAQNPAKSERALLSLYKAGNWLVKVRVNIPAGEDSGIAACRYTALTNLTLARALDQNFSSKKI